jgi:uncharacterized protein YukE
MSFRTIRFLGFLALWAVCISTVPAFAQEQSSSTAQTAKPDPAGSQTGAPATIPAPAPTKRVWTNDDIGDLHRNSTISTFSNPGSKPVAANGKPAPTVKTKDAKRYQDQITTLRAKLPALDEKISQLQGVLKGDTVQSARNAGGARIDDWHDELVKLQKQRDDIETKISSLQDEARHNGIPENQIPE